MKLLLTLAALLLATTTHATECRLKRPILLSANPAQSTLTFRNVKTDQVPQFTRPEKYNPPKQTLDLEVFPVLAEMKSSGFVGARIIANGTLESVGASNVYSGNISGLSGETRTTSNSTTYVFHHDSMVNPDWPECTICHVGENHVATEIKIESGFITSISLTFPVYQVWKELEYATAVAFTGIHQSICVLEAE